MTFLATQPRRSLGLSYTGAFWLNGIARSISCSIYGQDLVDLSESWRIIIGGHNNLPSRRERVFGHFGSVAGEPTASLSEGMRDCFSLPTSMLYRSDEKTQFFAAFIQLLIPNAGVRLEDGEAPAPQQDTQYEIGSRRKLLNRNRTFELWLFDSTHENGTVANTANPFGFYSLVKEQQHRHETEVNLDDEILPNRKIKSTVAFLYAVVSKDSNTLLQMGRDLLREPRRLYNVKINYTFHSGDLTGLSTAYAQGFVRLQYRRQFQTRYQRDQSDGPSERQTACCIT